MRLIMKIYWMTKVWPKWQIVIPQEARKEMGLEPSNKVIIFSPMPWKSVVIAKEDELQQLLQALTKVTNFTK